MSQGENTAKSCCRAYQISRPQRRWNSQHFLLESENTALERGDPPLLSTLANSIFKTNVLSCVRVLLLLSSLEGSLCIGKLSSCFLNLSGSVLAALAARPVCQDFSNLQKQQRA